MASYHPALGQRLSLRDPELVLDVASLDARVFLREAISRLYDRAVIAIVHLAFAIWGIFAWREKRPSK